MVCLSPWLKQLAAVITVASLHAFARAEGPLPMPAPAPAPVAVVQPTEPVPVVQQQTAVAGPGTR